MQRGAFACGLRMSAASHYFHNSCEIALVKPLPLSYIAPTVGLWRSLVAHLLREQGVGGSNPLSPTSNSSMNGQFIFLW